MVGDSQQGEKRKKNIMSGGGVEQVESRTTGGSRTDCTHCRWVTRRRNRWFSQRMNR